MHEHRIEQPRQLGAERVERAVGPGSERVELCGEVGRVAPRVEVLEEVSREGGAARGCGRRERGRDGDGGGGGGGISCCCCCLRRGERGRGGDPERCRSGGEPVY